MGLFDSLGGLFGGIGDIAQNTASDALSGIADAPIVQDVQDQVAGLSEVAEPITGAVGDVRNLGEELTNKLGL